MSFAGRLRSCGSYDAAALARRSCARHQTLHLLASTGWADGRVGKAGQQLHVLVALRAMVTIKRHGRAPCLTASAAYFLQVIPVGEVIVLLGRFLSLGTSSTVVQEPDQVRASSMEPRRRMLCIEHDGRCRKIDIRLAPRVKSGSCFTRSDHFATENRFS